MHSHKRSEETPTTKIGTSWRVRSSFRKECTPHLFSDESGKTKPSKSPNRWRKNLSRIRLSNSPTPAVSKSMIGCPTLNPGWTYDRVLERSVWNNFDYFLDYRDGDINKAEQVLQLSGSACTSDSSLQCHLNHVVSACPTHDSISDRANTSLSASDLAAGVKSKERPESRTKFHSNDPFRRSDIFGLQGQRVSSDGYIYTDEMGIIGKLIVGDPQLVKGLPIGYYGEIYDDAKTIVGLCQIISGSNAFIETCSMVREPCVVRGVTIAASGEVFDRNGVLAGVVAQGKPECIRGLSVNENGSVLDSDRNIVATVRFLKSWIGDGVQRRSYSSFTSAHPAALPDGLEIPLAMYDTASSQSKSNRSSRFSSGSELTGTTLDIDEISPGRSPLRIAAPSNQIRKIIRGERYFDESSQAQGMDKLKYSRCLEHEDASIVSIGTNQSDLNQKPEDIAIECGWPYGHQEFSGETNILQRVAPLGHGSLGIVEEVRVPNRTKTFVRKQVYIPHYNRRQRLKMVQAEGDFLKSLAHPHVVKVIGTFQEGVSTGKQSYSILMSPVGDCDLKHLLDILGEQELKKDTFREQRQWLSSWFKCLSSALAYIHGQGVRHQDIKPQNIIHRGPDVFFTDFSSASNFRLGCTTSTENPARTTHMYAAPEVIAHIDHYQKHGRGTDVFALGAVFCEMRTAAQGKSVGDFQLFCRGVDDPETCKDIFDLNQYRYAESDEDSDNRSVDSINVGIQLTISKQRTPSLDSVLLYGNKTDRIDRWFGQDAQYTEYIKPMLRVERRSRPTASSVARSFRDTSSWSNKPCVCESQLWSLESSTVCL